MERSEHGLEIEIDRAQQAPIYLQICERFKAAIAAGHLRPGDRVPALRGLAAQLNTARGTVEMAYGMLVDEGYLQMRGAAGTYVSSSLPSALVKQRARVRQPTGATRTAAAKPGVRSAVDRVSPPAAAQATLTDLGNEAKPLRPGLPALDAFPRKVWNRLVSYRARSGDRDALSYPDAAGYLPLRERIATYVGLSRGVECVPGQVFITSSYRASLELILRCLAQPGDSAWFEEPGYLLARNFLTDAGLQLVPVPVDGEGLDVDRGRKLAAQARFAFVTPSHQSPLGVTLTLVRRMELLAWASENGSWIVEDDYDSEFRYVGRPLPSLKSLDGRDCVIYCGTFSKVLFPGLRLAYVVVPERAVARFDQMTRSMNAGSPYLLQAAVADFIAQGHFARHLKRMRALYAERRIVIVDALRAAFGDAIDVEPPSGGMHLVVVFRPGPEGPIDDRAVAARAQAAGLAVLPLSAWYVNSRSRRALRGLVLGFANVTDARHATKLAQLLRQSLVGSLDE